MMKKITLRFRGDKSAVNQAVEDKTIGKLVNGAVIDVLGYRIGSFKRLLVDGGPYSDEQVIEIILGENDD